MTRPARAGPGGAGEDRGAGRAAALAALAAAEVGARLSYLPLLTLLLPYRMQALAGPLAAVRLSEAALAGAATASVSNLVFGWLGDRWSARVDRRAWLLAGLVLVAAGYAAFAAARTLPALVAALLLLQVAFNLVLSPLNALIAERFFRRPLPWALGASGAAQPAAGVLGAATTAVLLPFGWAPYAAVAALTAVLTAPFAFAGRRRRDAPAAPSPPPDLVSDGADAAVRSGSLAALWAWRAAIALAATLSGPYLLFRVRDGLSGPAGAPSRAAAALTAAAVGVSLLTAFSSAAHLAAAAALARASGRGLSRRLAAATSALALAGSLLLFALASGPPAFVLAYGLLGLANGAVQVADQRLALALLPSRRTLGRDLGLLNLANTLPQMAAPALALATPGLAQGRVEPLFYLAAAAGVVAAVLSRRL